MSTFRSQINKPDSFSFSSEDDTLNPLTGLFSSLRIHPPNPILGVDKAMLSKALIPLPSSLPDYALCFWYYIGLTLYCARLLPWTSMYLETGTRARGYNRRFTDIDNFVDALTFMKSGDSITENPFYTSSGITFNYDTTTYGNRILVSSGVGNFRVANYDDPAIATKYAATPIKNNGVIQPFVPGLNMNQRLGYTKSMAQGAYSTVGSTTPVYPDGNVNLQYTNFVHVCSSLVMGSSFGPRGMTNVLATVPLNPNALTNTSSYQSTEDNYVQCTEDNYIMNFDFKDDYGQPIPFPDSTPVSLQIQFQYN